MDFWSQKQGCRLPFTTSRTPQKMKFTWINMVRAVTTRSGARKHQLKRKSKIHNLRKQTQTMTPQAMTVLIILRTPQ